MRPRLLDRDRPAHTRASSSARADADWPRDRRALELLDPRVEVQELRRTRTDGQFAQLRRAMLIGASIVVGLIGLSLLLTALEQLQERRRVLAVLVALGIGIAVATGVALGAVLLRVLGSPVQVSWGDVAAMAGVGVAVVRAVTAASLPVLWRTMRPEGLRTEWRPNLASLNPRESTSSARAARRLALVGFDVDQPRAIARSRRPDRRRRTSQIAFDRTPRK